jgi:pyruvate/2-oxoglutarate dehydrogenase complex dihydrolipoamide dehydrogenase (E3) component
MTSMADLHDDTPFEPLRPLDEHNAALARELHPRDWRQPTPKQRYDLVVLGGGTAGLVTAAGAAGLGARVALIERELLGGDCLVTGCVPSKALIRAARAAHEARQGARYGVHAEDVTVDFPAVMERMRRERALISPNDSAARFSELGVDVFLGTGRFTGHDMVEVADSTARTFASLRFKRACIATGSSAAIPDVPGLAALVAASQRGQGRVVTHTGVFSFTELPRRLAVLGGGPIGAELAQTFARFGSTVTLVDRGSRLLRKDHADAGRILRAAFDRECITIHDGTTASGITRRDGHYTLTLGPSGAATAPASRDAQAGRGTTSFDADAVLVAAGRRPRVEGLGLEAAGIAFDPASGITVDERLRTTNRRVFAAGDCASRFQFTHMADALARIVIRNALFFGRARASRLVVPWVTYTDPEVAATGLSLDAAREAGHDDACTTRVDLASVDRARLDGETEGFLEVVHTRKGRLLGGTLVAAHAGESISELTLAITQRLSIGDLANVIHPYPTVAEAFRKAGDTFNRTRLTPRTAALLKWLARH